MTTENNEHPYENTLESRLEQIGSAVAEVDRTLRHVYETTQAISEQAERIYDAVAYRQDSPVYDADHDFLDMLEDE